MKVFSFLPVIAIAVALTGCSLGQDKPLSFDQLGEFSAYPLNKNMFRISYTGLDDVSYSAAQNIALVKAAQTAIINGYQYFTVLNSPTNIHRRPQKEVTNSGGAYVGGYWGGGPGYWGPGVWGPDYWGGDPGFWDGPIYSTPQVITTGPAEVAYNIICYNQEPKPPAVAYNATTILQTIGHKYGVMPTGQVVVQVTPLPTR